MYLILLIYMKWLSQEIQDIGRPQSLHYCKVPMAHTLMQL